jgi:hypothetical protein
MEDDEHFQIGFYRSGRAKLLRYWIVGKGEDYEAAREMLFGHGRPVPEKFSGVNVFVFDDPNQELFFKLRFSDAFTEEDFPWIDGYDYYDPYWDEHDGESWTHDGEPVHGRFFIPAKVKMHYGLGFD